MYRILTIFILLSFASSTAIANDLPIELLDGKKSITIKFEYISGYIVVDISVNGHDDVSVILDTGSQYTLFFDKKYGDELNLSYTDTIEVVGSDLRLVREAYISRETNIELNGCKAIDHDMLFLSENIDMLDKVIGRPVSGILGMSFFSNLALEINYQRQRIRIIDPTHIDRFTKFYDHKREITLYGRKPHITYHDEKGNTSTALIDTGSPLPYTTYLRSLGDLPEKWIPGVLGQGLGGPILGYIGLEDDLRIFEQPYSRLMTRYQFIEDLDSLSQASVEIRKGIIGNDLLSQFEIIIDFMNEDIYTQPNKAYDATADYNKSGIQVMASGEKLNEYKIIAVNMRSPGQLAGLQKGDQIISCNWMMKWNLSLGGLSRLFTSSRDRKIKLKILRDGEEIKKEFRLDAYLG